MMSIHLATYFANQHKTVALCDHDPQCSSLDWLRCRPEKYPTIHCFDYHRHPILTNRFDVAIHDMPVSCGVEELSSIASGHQLIIPILPSPTDLRACARFLMALNRSNIVASNPNRIGLVANRINVRTSYFKVLIAFLHHVNLPIVGYLRDTQNYVRTISMGGSIFDTPTRRFAQDLDQWQNIIDWVQETAGAAGPVTLDTKPVPTPPTNPSPRQQPPRMPRTPSHTTHSAMH